MGKKKEGKSESPGMVIDSAISGARNFRPLINHRRVQLGLISPLSSFFPILFLTSSKETGEDDGIAEKD